MTTASRPQTVFILGATGYIGSVITEFAIAEGYRVVGLSRSERGDEKLNKLGATPVRGDAQSFDVITRESAKADIIIHLIDTLLGKLDRPYSEVVRDSNNMMDAIVKGIEGSGKLLISTSGSLVVAPDPNGKETNEMSPLFEKPLNDRITSEQYALEKQSKGIKTCAIRLPPFVYGRGGSGVKLFMEMAPANGAMIYVDDGAKRTTTVHVDDAARLYLLAAKSTESGKAYNGTSETDVTFRDLAEALGKMLDLPTKAIPFADASASMGEFFATFLSTENRSSNSRARKELGWQPREKGILEEISSGSYVSVAEGIKKLSA